MVMKYVLMVKFWKIINIEFTEGDSIHYVLVDLGSMGENIELVISSVHGGIELLKAFFVGSKLEEHVSNSV